MLALKLPKLLAAACTSLAPRYVGMALIRQGLFSER